MGKYVFTEDVIGTTSTLGGCRSCGGGTRGLADFGQSGSYSAAVAELQTVLRGIAETTGNTDYHPGPVDGLYGRETHAAVIRVARDFLEPAGITTSECRSTCNTLWLRAKGACGDCLATYLRHLGLALSTISSSESVPVSLGRFGAVDEGTAVEDETVTAGVGVLSEAEIAEVVDRYKQFLDAYVAEYGDGGQLDPAQIARREDVSLEEAARLAAERAAAQQVATAPLPVPGPQPKKAGLGWWWAVIVVGLGVGAWYTFDKTETEPKRIGRDRMATEPVRFHRRQLPPKGGFRGGCGCGG